MEFYGIDTTDMTTRQINALFRQHDQSSLYPIRNRFNATERAIRRLRKTGYYNGGMEYAYALDNEIGAIVNDPRNQ